MTLNQAIRAARFVFVYAGDLAVRISKTEANNLRKQGTWTEKSHRDASSELTWSLDFDMNLHMRWS